MRKYLLVVLMACLLPMAAMAVVIDDFEDGNVSEWLQGTGGDPIGTRVTAIAAHDGNYGLEAGTIRTGWLYRDDAQVHLAQGNTMAVWTKIPNSSWTRNYIGFGATAAGCYSAVLGDNTNTFVIQLNSAYSFSDLASVPYVFINSYWYLVEIVWEVGGMITANLYDSDGCTLLATVSAVNSTYTQGGIAVRNFDSGTPGYFDTFMRDQSPSPVETSTWGGVKAMFR
jgi:hypothetical protein